MENRGLLFAVTFGILLTSLGLGHASSKTGLQTLKTFGNPAQSSAKPVGNLIEGTNGFFYGLSMAGGAERNGTVFRLDRDLGGLLVLKSFSSTNRDGRLPAEGAALLLSTNGMLYGTTSSGGESNQGTIFRINHDGTGYAVLKSFTGHLGDGATPASGLIQASNGLLYGTTFAGGDYNMGTVFSIAPEGTDYAVRKSFGAAQADGLNPTSALVQGTNGMLYGTTRLGGANGQGTIFMVNPETGAAQVLKSFLGALGDATQPWAGLMLGQDGLLYGTSYGGGNNQLGALFAIRHDGSFYRVFYHFTQFRGTRPAGALIQDVNGLLYGTTSGGGTSTNGTIFQIDSSGVSHQILKDYPAGIDAGAHPTGALLLASDGALYGCTGEGGMGFAGPGSGEGTAIKLEHDNGVYNKHTLVWNFSSAGGDAVNPQGRLIEAPDGWLYGITEDGGPYGLGTVFKIKKDGTGYMILKSFTGTSGDGAVPSASLVLASDGALYGTTRWDSRTSDGTVVSSSGLGTLFKMHLDGTGYQVVKQFTASNPGSDAGLIQASNGMLYGVSESPKRLFKLNVDGSGYAVVLNLPFTLSGTASGPLIQGRDGALYGGTSGNSPAIYRVNLDGSGFQIIKAFSSLPSSEDSSEWIAFTQGRDGVLYGASRNFLWAAVFKLNLDGTEFSYLHSFRRIQPDDERYPIASPIQANNGTLYGTTALGGDSESMGTLFQLCPDGSGYAVLNKFKTNDVIFPGQIIEGSEGVLYGVAPRRPGFYGALYSFEPPPFMLAPAANGTSVRIRLRGISGRNCAVERAESLDGPWSVVGTVPVGSSGAAEVEDTNPPATAAFYRARSD